MANSLKATFPALGRILGRTPDQLYGYQRAFVGAGLLDSIPGRGPGSGVSATPKSVAQFLICLLTQASIAENVRAAKAFARAREHSGKTCLLTEAKTFVDALERLLADESLAKRVNNIDLGMSEGYGTIRYDGGDWTKPPLAGEKRDYKFSIFRAYQPKFDALRFSALISGDVFLALAKVLK